MVAKPRMGVKSIRGGGKEGRVYAVFGFGFGFLFSFFL
jgi:hypothetical protein